MNEKRIIVVIKIDAAIEKPSPIKIIQLRTRSEIKPNSESFAVDWQLEGASAFLENNFSARFRKNASGLTDGRERHTISFVPPRLEPNK